MMTTRCLLAVLCASWILISAPRVATQAHALDVDFEFGSHEEPLPEFAYLDQGLRIIGMAIFVPPAGGWDSVHSGTRGAYPNQDVALDGTTAIAIAAEHGLSPSQAAKVSDILFVVPGTTIPATVDSFSVWIGFDENAMTNEVNRMIVEAYDVNGARIVDFTSDRLVDVANQLHEFNVPGIARVRMTQVDWVGLDDVTLATPRASVPSLSHPALLVLTVVLGSIAARAWRRRLNPAA